MQEPQGKFLKIQKVIKKKAYKAINFLKGNQKVTLKTEK